MAARGNWAHERRANLAELDPALRDRLLRLDEPVDRSDWEAVVGRSRTARSARLRPLALATGGAALLAAAGTLAAVLLLPGAGQPQPGAAPLRLALRMSDGTGLVLYSGAKEARFLDNSDGRPGEGGGTGARESAAVVRTLSGGAFRVPATLINATRPSRELSDGPLPGDQALISFRVFTTAELETAAGSAVLTCQYGFDQSATCNGAVTFADGVLLNASGTLAADAQDFALVVTDGNGRDDNRSGALMAAPYERPLDDLH